MNDDDEDDVVHTKRTCICKRCATWRLKRKRAAISALMELASKRCDKKNCGTVCLCGPCNARLALEWLAP